MVKKNLESQQIADEQLDDAVGGARLSACADAQLSDDVEDDDGDEVDLLFPAYMFRCPICGHPLVRCTCAR